jgi:dipeptidyl aminopeptidase/acylaminoacyl peptidase
MSVDGGARTKTHVADRQPRWRDLAGQHDVRTGVVLVQPSARSVPDAEPRRRDGDEVTTSPSPEWSTYNWVEPQLITYKSRDGKDVYARLYTPEMVGAKRDPKAPAVVFVHGAGYAQNAHKYWSTYYREYMFHHLLASKGYVVLDPDYRASAGLRPRLAHGDLSLDGRPRLNDVVDGAGLPGEDAEGECRTHRRVWRQLRRLHHVDGALHVADTFAAGAALRPVTDWAHYNHGYTSNILNEPQTDSEAYRKSSPIYFAEG